MPPVGTVDRPDVISRGSDEASNEGYAGGSARFALLLVALLVAFFLALVVVSYV
ncbi:hypothetical protein [Candidatus Halobonum tyrrellensis]|uniref:hypothetical protein n=1 Tax=Candidatus Halobonum tyrrellensis TaxID=1431545 RepID=UPI001377225E|nr:hypothetical protein [Candidatus Halobonum tyrrellensis]